MLVLDIQIKRQLPIVDHLLLLPAGHLRQNLPLNHRLVPLVHLKRLEYFMKLLFPT